MFELTQPNNIVGKTVGKSQLICSIDNFYKDPDKVVEYIESHEAEVWKEHQQPSYNTIHFSDLRHHIKNFEIHRVYEFIEDQFNCELSSDMNLITTNKTLWYENEFNNFKDNYWYPHRDGGNGRVTCMIYFDSSGTNLYELKINEEQYVEGLSSEHYEPWKTKKNFDLVYKIEAKYNRFVAFDGSYFHGAAVDDDTYFKKYRMNQVFFMDQKV